MTKGLSRILCGLLVSMVSTAAEATLIVSGDANISNSLSTPALFDNDTWFANILQGGSQVLVDDSSIAVSGTIDDFYNSLAGVSSSLLVGELTAASLAGVDLFISPASDNIYSAAEIAVLGAFHGGGGDVFLMAEHIGFPAQNANVNSVLVGLGSGISVSPAFELCGFNTLSGAQIAPDPFNAGVASFEMACTSEVIGGTPLFFTTPDFAMVAYEGGPVPEPTTFGLLGLGLVALGIARKRLGQR